ncbi:hypothetical protein ADIWIN_3319 [Winogradskyella psychrotolerans RS-3]|uniref:Lipoprotein n=1 Tax=Winogradskyella psychrotolerans RS-3 TaxID=641526 RepID=S7VMP6_9FLAO|nr:hypothetical protein [Winogradskyella psychrotolerans]EPR70672.1 hypothetical protein ADIWIN_3319 [Winogradskyella psychrotolerans RS-3]
MKKHRLKNYLKLGILLFGVLITTISCDKDDTIGNNQVPVLSNNTKFKLQRITNPPVSQNKELSEKLSSFKSKSNLNDLDYQAREVYNAELDFTIDTDISNYIEYGAYHSYTFPITRIEDNGLVENLLLSLQIDGTYKAYLVTYDLTEDEKLQIQNNENIDLSDKTTFSTLQDQEWASSLFARIGDNGICHEWITITPRCTFDGEHSAEDRETGNNGGFQCAANFVAEPYTISSFTECPKSGGGAFNPTDPTGPLYDDYGNPYINLGGGNNDGSTGSNPNSNDNNDNSNDGNQGENTDCLQTDANGNCNGDMTAVIIRGNDDNEPDCENEISGLSEIVNTPEIKAELNRLKFNMGFATEEDGKRFIYTGSNINAPSTYNDANFNEQLAIDSDGNSLDFPDLQNNTLVGAHFHPFADIDGEPIRQVPSGTDIAEHINMIKKVYATNPNAANQVTNFVISKGNSGRTYILRANNAQNIVNNTLDYTNDDNRDDIRDKVEELIKPLRWDAFNEHEKAFNSFLTENFPDLDVLKAEYDANGNITKFCKLKTQQ